MDVMVLSRLRKEFSRRFGQLSLAGDSLPVRLRSTTIGLVGLAAAVGLGLVAMISQQSWPDSINAPLPQTPRLGVVRNDPLAPPPPRPSARSQGSGSRVVTSEASSSPGAAVDTQLGDAQQLEAPASAPTPAPEAPELPEPQGESPPPSSAASEPAGADAPVAADEPPPATEGPGPQTAGEPEAPAGEPAEMPSEPAETPGDFSPGNGPPSSVGGGHGHPGRYPGSHGKPSWAGH